MGSETVCETTFSRSFAGSFRGLGVFSGLRVGGALLAEGAAGGAPLAVGAAGGAPLVVAGASL